MLPEMQQMSIRSMLLHGECVNLWLHDYDDLALIPDDIVIKCDIHYVIEEYPKQYMPVKNILEEFKTSNSTFTSGSPLATYSDIIRCEILKQYNGWWLDDDIILLKKLEHLENRDFGFATEYNWCSSFKYDAVPCNCAMYSGRAFYPNLMLIHSEQKLKSRNFCYIEFGPLMLRNLVEMGHMDMEDHAFRPEDFLATFNTDRHIFTDRIDFNALNRLISTTGIHLTGLSEHINGMHGRSVINIIYKMIEAGAAPTYSKLLKVFKQHNEDFYDFVKQYRENNTVDVLNYTEMQARYKISKYD